MVRVAVRDNKDAVSVIRTLSDPGRTSGVMDRRWSGGENRSSDLRFSDRLAGSARID